MEDKITKFNQFILDCKSDIEKNNAGDNYCIILYKARGIWNEYKYVNCIFKSIEEFEKRGLDAINRIDFDCGVSLQLWFFD